MTKQSSLKSQSGFSLIELMVVVAIIGLLASVAIPQFSKFQNRAKQAEAQETLSAIYSAEVGFQAQYNTFYGGLATAGFSPPLAGAQVRYDAGFSGTITTLPSQVTASVGDSSTISGICPTCAWVQPTGNPVVGAPSSAAGANTAMTASTFTADAQAILGTSGNAAAADVWTVDEKKAIKNKTNGT